MRMARQNERRGQPPLHLAGILQADFRFGMFTPRRARRLEARKHAHRLRG